MAILDAVLLLVTLAVLALNGGGRPAGRAPDPAGHRTVAGGRRRDGLGAGAGAGRVPDSQGPRSGGGRDRQPRRGGPPGMAARGGGGRLDGPDGGLSRPRRPAVVPGRARRGRAAGGQRGAAGVLPDRVPAVPVPPHRPDQLARQRRHPAPGRARRRGPAAGGGGPAPRADDDAGGTPPRVGLGTGGGLGRLHRCVVQVPPARGQPVGPPGARLRAAARRADRDRRRRRAPESPPSSRFWSATTSHRAAPSPRTAATSATGPSPNCEPPSATSSRTPRSWPELCGRTSAWPHRTPPRRICRRSSP